MDAFADAALTNFNPDCGDFLQMAERELSAFFGAVKELFGPEQAEISAEDWLQELTESDFLPASTGEWRRLTAKASNRLASRVGTPPAHTSSQSAVANT
jgi:hypothetical protein